MARDSQQPHVPFVPNPDIGPAADARRRAAILATHAKWCQQHAARLDAQHPRVAADMRSQKLLWLNAGLDRPMDAAAIAECAQRAISRERVRRHGALDPDTAAAQHAAIRADWGIA